MDKSDPLNFQDIRDEKRLEEVSRDVIWQNFEKLTAFIEKQAEDPLPSGGGMNAVPNAIELERNRYLVRGP